ncbi:MAG: hypothetical protein CHACPFDD_01299 [Phycisphaerae bacterium]|nr:hypothetical protein [Phycisphaerae bacterium]
MQAMRRNVTFYPMMALAALSASGQTSIDGISFVDRNLSGEVVLGAYRGGVAVIDYDRDGWMDLIIGDNFGLPTRLFRNVSDTMRPGARTFLDVTVGSGLNDADGNARSAVGIVVGDYDNDGDDDVYVIGRSNPATSFGLLYRNDGGTFINVSDAAGVRVSTTTNPESASWCDYDVDGDLDLLVCCNLAPPYMFLFRNNGNGTFADASSLLPAVAGFGHVYSHSWLDYDRDGWPDCFPITASGAGHDVVLHNVPDGAGGRKFVNVADALGFTNLGPAPMGIAAGDYDGDGDLDLGISDALVGTYFRNDGGSFAHITPFSTMFGWGVDWLDVDNDGDVDFYTAGSWSTANFDNLQRNLGGGAFQDISATLNTASRATQYSAQVDFNNDGRRDLIAINPTHSVSVYENVSTTGGHWLALQLRGDGVRVNRNAVGAFVRLTAGGVTQVRELVSGSSTTATEDLRLHFGLGAADVVDQIEVQWPRLGALALRDEVFEGPFAADQMLTLAPTLSPGDMNCDGSVNGFDVEPFVIALGGQAAYEAAYPECHYANADVSGDGSVNGFDVDGFVELLTGP